MLEEGFVPANYKIFCAKNGKSNGRFHAKKIENQMGDIMPKTENQMGNFMPKMGDLASQIGALYIAQRGRFLLRNGNFPRCVE